MPDGSGWGKGFLNNFVCNEESLTDKLEPAREPMVLGSFEPDGGRVGFFEHETHFGDDREAASDGSDSAIFCGGRRDAANQLGGDHPGSKFRNKIVDPIEQNAQEPCGGINIHITMEYNVILFCMIVNAKISSIWRLSAQMRSATLSRVDCFGGSAPFLAGN